MGPRPKGWQPGKAENQEHGRFFLPVVIFVADEIAMICLPFKSWLSSADQHLHSAAAFRLRFKFSQLVALEV